MRIAYLLTAVLIGLPAFAQKYEFGVLGGVSFYDKKTVTNPRGNADAGFSPGYAAGVSLGQNMYNHISGELRYTFLHNSMKLESGSAKATFGAIANAVHYDVVIHATGMDSSTRPYVSVGGGIKYYQGTGTEQAFQPLSNIALLTKTKDIEGLVSVGGGVKLKLNSRLWIRLDVRDYLSPFPKSIIAPAAGSSVGGWVNNIVGTGGVVFTF